MAILRALTLSLPMVICSVYAQAQDSSSSGSAHSVFASYEFYGRAPYPGYSRGGRLGYIFNNRQELGLSYMSSEQGLLLTSYVYEEYALTLNFWLNDYIYFSLGTGHRTATITSQVFTLQTTEDDVSAAQQVNEEYKLLTGNTAIGFEIPIFANFLIGAEIFGLSSPIHWLKRSSNYPANAADYEEDPKSYPYIRDGLKTNYHLLRSFVKVRL